MKRFHELQHGPATNHAMLILPEHIPHHGPDIRRSKPFQHDSKRAHLDPTERYYLTNNARRKFPNQRPEIHNNKLVSIPSNMLAHRSNLDHRSLPNRNLRLLHLFHTPM